MILSEILSLEVVDPRGARVGAVIDVRFVVDGAPSQLLADARLHGFVVGRRARRSFVGYERTDTNRPAGIASYLRWRERGAFLVLWKDVASITEQGVTLRPGYRRYSPMISG
jgi:sporulation protein YlmC with PRC-barrel domain